MSLSRTLLTGAALAASVQLSSAALLVREGFDSYGSGTDLSGSTTATSATGLTGLFKNNNIGTYSISAGGLAFSTYSTSAGNKLSSNFHTGGTSLQATLSISSTVASGSDLWSSYLVNYSTISANTTALSEVRIHSSDAGTGSSARFRSMGNSAEATGTTFSGIGYDASNITSTGNAMTTGTTYMVLSQYTNVNATGAAVGTQWILTETQYADFRDSGFSLTNLQARTVGTGAANIYSKVIDNATSQGFANGNFLQIAGNADQATFDEIRFATSLLDAVSPIPEPSVAGLLLLGAAGFLRRRR